MYHCYLRGRKNELLAIRDAISKIQQANITPIIEPISQNPNDLASCVRVAKDNGVNLIVITNPQVQDGAITNNPPNKPGGKRDRDSQHPDKRKSIVPSSFTLKSKDARLRRIFGELKKIDPDEFTYAGNYLLRVFLEKIAHMFATSRGKHNEIQGQKLHIVLGVCRDILTKEDLVREQKVKILSQLSSKDNHFCSPDTLGAGVHGVLVPKAIDLKKSFDELMDVFLLMLKDIV